MHTHLFWKKQAFERVLEWFVEDVRQYNALIWINIATYVTDTTQFVDLPMSIRVMCRVGCSSEVWS